MSLIATAFLLVDGLEPTTRDAARRAIDEKKVRLDARFVKDLYAACPPRLKPSFAFTAAVARLPPSDFDPIFRDAYRRKMTVELRRDLASRLDYFLRRNPPEAERYRPLILSLMRNPRAELCTVGLGLAGLLDALGPAELALLERKLSSRSADQRMNALNAMARLLSRRHLVASETLDFCTSAAVLARVRHLRAHDRNEFVRACARNLLRTARPPARPVTPPRSARKSRR
jgi:hypothetical protein